jgi:hypothetical protein
MRVVMDSKPRLKPHRCPLYITRTRCDAVLILERGAFRRDGWDLRQIVQRRHNAPAELLDLGERVNLPSAIDHNEGSADRGIGAWRRKMPRPDEREARELRDKVVELDVSSPYAHTRAEHGIERVGVTGVVDIDEHFALPLDA